MRGWKKWTFFFTVIGMNSITIYMAQRIIGFRVAHDFPFGGLALPGCVGRCGLAGRIHRRLLAVPLLPVSPQGVPQGIKTTKTVVAVSVAFVCAANFNIRRFGDSR